MNNNLKTKIAILLPSLNVGGAEKLIYEELRYLKDDERFEFEVHVIFEEGELYKDFFDLGIPIYVWNAQHKSIEIVLVYWKISQYLKSRKTNILHCHLVYKFGTIVGKLAKTKKVITTVHTDIKFNWIERVGLKKSDVLIACGNRVKRNIEGFFPVERIAVINNATRLQSSNNKCLEDINVTYNLRKDNLVILSIGRLIADKGYNFLIESFKRVSDKYSKIVLIIAGDGPEKDNLNIMINELGLINKVYLIGNVRNVEDLYKRAFIYVNSSIREGLPMTVIEAMSHGKPIVATDAGGNSELIKNGETGLLVSPSDTTALESAIKLLLGSSEKRKMFSENAKNQFIENNSIENHCLLLSKVYLNNRKKLTNKDE